MATFIDLLRLKTKKKIYIINLGQFTGNAILMTNFLPENWKIFYIKKTASAIIADAVGTCGIRTPKKNQSLEKL